MMNAEAGIGRPGIGAGLRLGTIVQWIFFLAVAAIIAAPIAMVVLGAVNVADALHGFRFGFGNWTAAWSDPSIGAALRNTVSIVAMRAIFGFVIAIPLAWLVARTNIPGARWLEFGFWVAYFMPSLAFIQGWVFLLEGQRGLLNHWIEAWIGPSPFDVYSYWGIIWVHLMSQNVSALFIFLALGFRNMDSNMEEAARIAGASKWKVLRDITLPLSRPLIAMLIAVAIIRGLQSYEVEAVLGTPAGIQVYSTLMVQMLNDEPPRIAQGSALSMLILAAILPLILLQRLYVGRRQYATVSGKMRLALIGLGRMRWVAFAIVLTMVLLQTLVPFVSVVASSMMVRWGFFSIPSPWTLARWKTVFDNDQFVASLLNTLTIGLIAGILASVLCFAIAYILVRTRFTARAALDFASWLPWAVPGVLLSLGLLTLVLAIPPLRVLHGSLAVLVLAIVMFGFPLGVNLLKSGLMQVNTELEEASTVCGSGRLRTQWRINVPILAPMLIAVGLMTFVTAVNEISGVVLLASTNVRTLALLSLDYLTGVQTEKETAAVLTTIMTVLCVGVALVARSFGISIGATVSRPAKPPA
jgi:iron(III) transport system permease protein